MTQTIIRAPRYERFTILDMRIVEDTRLSWAARGVLAYLLSRPDHWQIQITDLRRRGDLGRDGCTAYCGHRDAPAICISSGVATPVAESAAAFTSSPIWNPLHPALPEEASRIRLNQIWLSRTR